MAEAVKDYQKLEHDIIRLAGGADNIASAQRWRPDSVWF